MQEATNMLLANCFLVFIQVCCFAAGFIIERPTDGAGDIFAKKLDLPSGTIILRQCSKDQIGGDGSVTAIASRNDFCACTWGETFLIDGNTPKCLNSNGQGEGCNFHFKSQYYVKMLNPSMMTNNFDIGEVVYRSEANSLGYHKITDLWNWNITWKRPTETNLFHFEDKNLKWTSTNSANLARKYSGILFKLKVSACVLNRGGNCKSYYYSCLLLKFSGSKNYPLPDPNAKVKTTTTTVTPTTSLPSSTFRSAKHESTQKVLKTSYSTTLPRSKSAYISSSSKYSSLQPSTVYYHSSLPTSLSQRKTPVLPKCSFYLSKSSVYRRESSILDPRSTHNVVSSFSSKTAREPLVKSSSSLSSSLPKASFTSRASGGPSPSVTPTSSNVNTNGNLGKRKDKSSNSATIAGICVGVLLAIFVVLAVFYFRKKKFAFKKGNAGRRETLTLNLTSNTFLNNSGYEANGSLNSAKNNLGNPIYEEKLKCQKSGKTVLPREYENAGQPEYTYASTDPIYKEVESEQPVYQETGELYQPLSEPNKPEPGQYQPIDASTLQRGNAQLQSPVYQVLDDQTTEEPARAQSPIYHMVDPDVYQAIDQSAVQNNDGYYTGLKSGANAQPPIQEPLYRELDSQPIQEPLYRELDNDVDGRLNLKYEDDESAI